MTRSPMHDEALCLVLALNAPVVPLHGIDRDGRCTCGRRACPSAGKHPATRRGLHDASTSPRDIRPMFDATRPRNVGLVTGGAARLVVIDLDPKPDDPLDAIRERLQRRFTLPETLETQTGGGGVHLFFRSRRPLSSRVRVLPGVDVRADGGYVVAPPSRHASGRQYEWRGSLDARRVVALPEAAEHALRAPTYRPRVRRPMRSTDGGFAARIIGEVALAPIGTRNERLNWAAYILAARQLRGEPDGPWREQLLDAALVAGLPEGEALRTMRSAIAGAARAATTQGGRR